MLHLPEVVCHLSLFGFDGSYVVSDGVVLILTDQLVDWTIQRCRKEEGLSGPTRLIDELAYHRKKSHICHTICLVDDYVVDTAEIDYSLLHEIGQPTWAGDDDVETTSQNRKLLSVADAAVERCHLPINRPSKRGDYLFNL
jgi:hypothetical protein